MKLNPDQISKTSRFVGEFAEGAVKTAVATGGAKMLFRLASKVPGPIGKLVKLAALAAPIILPMINRRRDEAKNAAQNTHPPQPPTNPV